MSDGRRIAAPAVEERPAGRHHVLLAQRGADVVALGGEEREAHAATDEHLVRHAAAARRSP